MDLVWKILNRSMIYQILGKLLFSVGIVLGYFLAIRIARETIDDQISRQADYLYIVSTLVFELPPATPLPTFTPTPIPTATPLPLPATRLSIPAIGLNTSVQEIFPTEKVSSNGEKVLVWEAPVSAVGHYYTSENPGGSGNIVLIGHNNYLGEVFRSLNQLNPGDEIILFTNINEYHYQVQSKYIIPYLGAEAEGDAILQSYAAPKSTELITLISCWPYATNANRIVVIAVPISN